MLGGYAMTKSKDELFNDYQSMIKLIVNDYRVPHMSFDDVFQEMSLVFLKCYDDYDESKGAFSTFLWHSMLHKIYKLSRPKKINSVLSLNFVDLNGDELIDYVDSGEDVEEKLILEETELEIIKALDEMKYGYYTKLFMLYNIPQKEIARVEHKSLSFIQKTHSANLKKLKESLEK